MSNMPTFNQYKAMSPAKQLEARQAMGHKAYITFANAMAKEDAAATLARAAKLGSPSAAVRKANIRSMMRECGL